MVSSWSSHCFSSEHWAHDGGNTYTRPFAVQSLGSISHYPATERDVSIEQDEFKRFLDAIAKTGKVNVGFGAARKVIMPTSMHCHVRYANNRAEVSQEHTRAHERQMRRFKST